MFKSKQNLFKTDIGYIFGYYGEVGVDLKNSLNRGNFGTRRLARRPIGIQNQRKFESRFKQIFYPKSRRLLLKIDFSHFLLYTRQELIRNSVVYSNNV